MHESTFILKERKREGIRLVGVRAEAENFQPVSAAG
jgi:hypothetical protein